MCRVFLNDRLDELEKLKNTFTVIEANQKCAVCGELLSNEETIALTKDRERVHVHCLSDEEKKSMLELEDLF